MGELVLIGLLGITVIGITIKYLTYKCDIKEQMEDNSNLIVEEFNEDEVPPKYEDI